MELQLSRAAQVDEIPGGQQRSGGRAGELRLPPATEPEHGDEQCRLRLCQQHFLRRGRAGEATHPGRHGQPGADAVQLLSLGYAGWPAGMVEERIAFQRPDQIPVFQL